MARIPLRIYKNPSSLEVFLKVRRKDGDEERLFAMVDTGAAVSLLPASLLESIDYRLNQHGKITIDQAGIAKQAFEATEAFVHVFFEDVAGIKTKAIEVLAWFADTDFALIGFEGILDQGILHVDMPNLNGYLELTLDQA